MLFFEVAEARKRGEDRQSFGVARVDTGEQRLAQPLDGLLPEAAAQERRNRLVPAAVPSGITRSRPMRSLPGQEKRPLRAKGRIFVGTASIMPSGSGWSFLRWRM